MSADGVAALAYKLDQLAGELGTVDAELTVIRHVVDDGELTKDVCVDAIEATRAHLERLAGDLSQTCGELLRLSGEAVRVDEQ